MLWVLPRLFTNSSCLIREYNTRCSDRNAEVTLQLRPVHTLWQRQPATGLDSSITFHWSLWWCPHGVTVTRTSSQNGFDGYQWEYSHIYEFCCSRCRTTWMGLHLSIKVPFCIIQISQYVLAPKEAATINMYHVWTTNKQNKTYIFSISKTNQNTNGWLSCEKLVSICDC